jgi:hypothetical protein
MPFGRQKDEHGNVILRPMKGYEVQRIGGESLLVVIEYVETTKQLETGELETSESKRFQTVVYAQQALKFAETLKRAASAVVSPKSLDKIQ